MLFRILSFSSCQIDLPASVQENETVEVTKLG